MTRTPQPRFIADVRLAVTIGAANEEEADERLAAVQEFLRERLARSTFTRLPGRPEVVLVDQLLEAEHA